LTSKNLVPFH